MFLCRVAVGDWCRGQNNQLVPDSKTGDGLNLYDCTVDNISDPSIFVCYHDAQAVPRLAVRHELIVLAATPVSNGNTAQKHPLDIRTVRAGVGGAARVGGVTGEVDTPSIGHGVLAGKGAVESLGLDLGHCIM